MTKRYQTHQLNFNKKYRYFDYQVHVRDENCNQSHSKTPYRSRNVVSVSKKISNCPEKTVLHSEKGPYTLLNMFD